MANPEKVSYAYSPREAAQRFLVDVFPDEYTPTSGSREVNPSYTIHNIANMVWHDMHDKGIREDPVRYLVECSQVTWVALVIADLETGLTLEQERFALYATAASLQLQTELDIMRYEMDGRWNSGRLDILRPTGKEINTDSGYLEEKRTDLEKLRKLQAELMEVIVPSPNKES